MDFNVAEVCETTGDRLAFAVSLVIATNKSRKMSRFLFPREGKQAASAYCLAVCIATSIVPCSTCVWIYNTAHFLCCMQHFLKQMYRTLTPYCNAALKHSQLE
jgi:hypothetical protein